MKIIIEHSKTKRQITGPFNICIGREDLEVLVAQLQHAVAREHTYGWIQIHERSQPNIVNTPPSEWDDPL